MLGANKSRFHWESDVWARGTRSGVRSQRCRANSLGEPRVGDWSPREAEDPEQPRGAGRAEFQTCPGGVLLLGPIYPLSVAQVCICRENEKERGSNLATEADVQVGPRNIAKALASEESGRQGPIRV